ncbi:MAG: hypothetical protein JW999_11285 [Methanotrichaceae archaeon]|nr:hypothetical protein [Methanotrichaceae archaeon]
MFLAAVAALLFAAATASAGSICDNAPCENAINVMAWRILPLSCSPMPVQRVLNGGPSLIPPT